ncbi:MAG: hypothetical protein WCI74_16055 [Actinomycetes bacterium]
MSLRTEKSRFPHLMVFAAVIALSLALAVSGSAQGATQRVSASGASQSIDVNWTKQAGASGYRVSWRAHALKKGQPVAAWAKKWTVAAALPKTALGYTIGSLASGKEYQVRLEFKRGTVWSTRATLTATPQSTTQATCTTGGPCSVGDIGPGDGVVIYAAAAPQAWGTYLEAATKDLPPAKGYAWCSNTTSQVPPGTGGITSLGTAIGTGAANTNAMLAGGFCTTGAGVAARAYRGGAKSDWFLPAKDELALIFAQRALIGGLPQGAYWSSSEATSSAPTTGAWMQGSIVAFGQNTGSKEFPNSVRPMRAF